MSALDMFVVRVFYSAVDDYVWRAGVDWLGRRNMPLENERAIDEIRIDAYESGLYR